MSLSQQRAVDDVIDDIADDPEIGEQKQGDLSHLRVYKFRISKMEYLLGYHWDDSRIVINLLQLGSHENYYADAKKAARVDKKFIAD
jgi:mRNA-degrading endonuclease RelE of RelBE toxin-antitoxin system